MAGIPVLMFGAGLMAAVVYLPLAAHPPAALRSFMKTLPLVLFGVAAWLVLAPACLITALALSALGDLALSRPGKTVFLSGLCAFALAHLFYTFSFLALSSQPLWHAFIASPLVAVAMILIALSTQMWLIPHTGKLRWPVRIYVLLIGVMMLAALTLPAGFAGMTVGAGIFVLSDLILSLRLFRMVGQGDRARWAGLAVWVFYIAGQGGLILWGFIGPWHPSIGAQDQLSEHWQTGAGHVVFQETQRQAFQIIQEDRRRAGRHRSGWRRRRRCC